MDEDDSKIRERIKDLEAELIQLNKQIPAHSMKPEMIMRMEELEEELEQLKKKIK